MNRALTLIKNINEILSHSYDYDHKSSYNDRLHQYKFKTSKNNEYTVQIAHFPHYDDEQNVANVTFNDSGGYEDLNHQEPNSAHKVLSTVVNVIKHHVKNNPENASVIMFQGDKHHAPIYKAMAKRLASKYVEKPLSTYTEFRVNRSDIK